MLTYNFQIIMKELKGCFPIYKQEPHHNPFVVFILPFRSIHLARNNPQPQMEHMSCFYGVINAVPIKL